MSRRARSVRCRGSRSSIRSTAHPDRSSSLRFKPDFPPEVVRESVIGQRLDARRVFPAAGGSKNRTPSHRNHFPFIPLSSILSPFYFTFRTPSRAKTKTSVATVIKFFFNNKTGPKWREREREREGERNRTPTAARYPLSLFARSRRKPNFRVPLADLRPAL